MSRSSTVVGTISLLLALMADQATAQRRSLSGRVVDEAGNPIGNAVVCTIESNSLGAGLVSALSDKDGYFVLGADNRFSIPLTTWHDAYAISLVKAAAGTDAVTIRLTRGATLSGTVKTSIGSGVPDLEVRVGYLKSAIPFQPITSAIGGILRTDAAGRFTIKRLPLGLPFRIEIAANNTVVGWSDRITLTSSDAVTPVAIVVRPMVSLNGSVGDLNGVGVKGAAITAWVRPNGRNDYAFEAPSVTRTESDAYGRFMLQIPRDTQALIRASVRGYVDATTTADVSAESEDARALQLTLARIP